MKKATSAKIAVCVDEEINHQNRLARAQLVEDTLSPALSRAADQIAQELGLPRLSTQPEPDLLLTLTDQRIEIRWLSEPGTRPTFVNLEKLDTSSNAGRTKKQPLAKAVGLKKIEKDGPLTILDCTAGFGEDSWLLASWGCQVVALERNPVIATLLADGLRRAGRDHPEIARQIQIIQADAKSFLDNPKRDNHPFHPDVIYLDPMFPVKTKSAREGKQMRLLREIVGDDQDSDQLIAKAAAIARFRVVVKRPLKAPLLASQWQPVSQHEGKAVRYDVYSAAS